MSKRLARMGKRVSRKPRLKKRKHIAIACSLLILTLAIGVMAQWKILPGTSKPLALTPAPTQTGSFNADSPSKEYIYAGGRLVATEEPSVTASPTPTPTPDPTTSYTLTASPTSTVPGAQISVTWAAPQGHSATDWIGLYKAGDPDTSQLSAQYVTASTGGTSQFTAPSTAGQYEFRYFLNNVYTKAAQSNTITVAEVAQNSLSLNGSSQYVKVSDNPALDITGALTVEAWVKPATMTGYHAIVDRLGGNQGYDGGYALYLVDGRARLYVSQNGVSYTYVLGKAQLSPDRWHHVAGVFDGEHAQMRLYVDGMLDAALSSTFVPSAGQQPLTIGEALYQNTHYFRFDGLIDEVRLSDTPVYNANFSPVAHLTKDTNTRGLWKFDGQTLADSSDNHLETAAGTGSGTTPPGYSTDVPAGVEKNSISLNGVNPPDQTTAYVNILNSPSINITGPFTLEAWVKPNSTAGYHAIADRFGGAASATDGGYALLLINGRATLYVTYNSTSYIYALGNIPVSAGSWHHIAGVYDGSHLRLYVDGVADTSTPAAFGPQPGTQPLTIGVELYGGVKYFPFDGLIDEVRLSDAALYTQNFTAERSLGRGGNTRGLWKFDARMAMDASGQGNVGTLTGGADFSTDVP